MVEIILVVLVALRKRHHQRTPLVDVKDPLVRRIDVDARAKHHHQRKLLVAAQDHRGYCNNVCDRALLFVSLSRMNESRCTWNERMSKH